MNKYNQYLLRSMLNIFLKREAGINKKAFRWLNISDTLESNDIDYIERGLRTYLNGNEEDLILYFRILFALTDKEFLITILLERTIFEALNAMKKESKDFKKYDKYLSGFGLDDLWRIFYMKFKESSNESTDENFNGNDDITTYKKISDDNEKVYGNDDKITDKKNSDGDKKSSGAMSPQEILQLVIFACENLEIFDEQVSCLHLPIFAYFVVKNKPKVEFYSYSTFMKILFSRGSYFKDKNIVKDDLEQMIDSFYEKEILTEISEVDIFSGIGKEMGNINIYKNTTNSLEFDNCIILKDGIFQRNPLLTSSEIATTPPKLLSPIITKNKSIITDSDFFSFDHEDMKIIQSFTILYGYQYFSQDFIDHLTRFITITYKYKALIDLLIKDDGYSSLFKNLWNDFITYKCPNYILSFDQDILQSNVISSIPYVNIKDICLFLRSALEMNMYHEILYIISSILNRSSIYYMNLILDVNNVSSVFEFLLNKFNNSNIEAGNYKYSNIPDFNVLGGILRLSKDLLNNQEARKVLKENVEVVTERYGRIGVREGFIKMLIHLIVNEAEQHCYIGSIVTARTSKNLYTTNDYLNDSKKDSNNDNKNDINNSDKNSDKNDYLLVDNKKDHLNDNKEDYLNDNKEDYLNDSKKDYLSDDNIEDDKNEDDNKEDVIEIVNKHLLNNSSAITKQLYIQRESFSVLHKLNALEIPVVIENLEPIKFIIKKYLNDYYIIKKSLFLLKNEFEFIIKYLLSFYKEIFVEISQMENSDNFFIMLVKTNPKGSPNMMIEIYNYLRNIPKYKFDTFYSQVIKLVNENCNANHVAIYHNNKIEVDDNIEYKKDTGGSCVITYTFDIIPTVELCKILYKNDPSLFITTLSYQSDILALFYCLPFKKNALRKLLVLGSPIILESISKVLSKDAISEILKSESDYFKNTFGYTKLDYNTTFMILELFKEISGGEIMKIVISNLLYILENKIVSGLRLDIIAENDILVLRNITRLQIQDQNTILTLKSCLYGLLQSKKYKKEAFEIISDLIFNSDDISTRKKCFVDGFVAYYSSEYFVFERPQSALLKKLCDSKILDPTVLIQNFFHGFDTSFFMSQQSDSQQKIISLRKISFLILSNPIDTFSLLSDKLIASINHLISSPTLVKVEVYRL